MVTLRVLSRIVNLGGGSVGLVRRAHNYCRIPVNELMDSIGPRKLKQAFRELHACWKSSTEKIFWSLSPMLALLQVHTCNARGSHLVPLGRGWCSSSLSRWNKWTWWGGRWESTSFLFEINSYTVMNYRMWVKKLAHTWAHWTRTVAVYSGMLPCFFHGISCFFVARRSRSSQIRSLVSRGGMMSSINPVNQR